MKKFIVVLLLFISNVTFADTLDTFISLAQANADKFESEMPNLKRTITFKYKPLIYWPLKSAQYDPISQTLSLNSIFEMLDGWIERCKPLTEQLGINGFGAKIKFTRYKCSKIVLKDEWNFPVNSDSPNTVSISMSPSEYRTLKSDAPTLEIVFYIKGNPQEEVFKSFDHIEYATIRSPKEKIIKGFHVTGQLKKITIFSSDGNRQLATFERMFCSNEQTDDCVTK